MVYYASEWRKRAAPIITKVLEENKGKSEAEIRLALREAYPFGPRQYHPYKIWLDEIKRQTGRLWPIGHKRAWENSRKRQNNAYQKLLEWEGLYGRRNEE